jgi:hypothetical protein
VRDHLDGVAEVLAAALLRDDGRVDLTGGDVGGLVEVDVEEPLVVPDVEVGLGAVVGDEHLAVLERVHRARVDVEVRVELLHHDPQTTGGEQVAEARCGEALAERRHDAAGHEDVLRDGGLRRPGHAVEAVGRGGVRRAAPVDRGGIKARVLYVHHGIPSYVT